MKKNWIQIFGSFASSVALFILVFDTAYPKWIKCIIQILALIFVCFLIYYEIFPGINTFINWLKNNFKKLKRPFNSYYWKATFKVFSSKNEIVNSNEYTSSVSFIGKNFHFSKYLDNIHNKVNEDKDGYLLNLLNQYIKQEKNDLDNHLIITTFQNYSTLVTELVKYTKNNYSSPNTVTYCISQNTTDFEKWFNFNNNNTPEKWVDYLKAMHKFSVDDRIHINRIMAFTSDKTVSGISNTSKIAFPIINEVKTLNKKRINEKYINTYKEKYITPKNISKTLDETIQLENPIDDYLINSREELNEFISKLKSLDKNKGENIESKKLKPPCFIISDYKLNNDCSHNLVDFIDKIFNNRNHNNLFSSYYIENLDRFYNTTENRLPEDFFAIGLKDNNTDEIEWQFLLATQIDDKLDTVKLYFLSKKFREAKDSCNNSSKLEWYQLQKYIDNELLKKTQNIYYIN